MTPSCQECGEVIEEPLFCCLQDILDEYGMAHFTTPNYDKIVFDFPDICLSNHLSSFCKLHASLFQKPYIGISYA